MRAHRKPPTKKLPTFSPKTSIQGAVLRALRQLLRGSHGGLGCADPEVQGRAAFVYTLRTCLTIEGCKGGRTLLLFAPGLLVGIAMTYVHSSVLRYSPHPAHGGECGKGWRQVVNYHPVILLYCSGNSKGYSSGGVPLFGLPRRAPPERAHAFRRV